MLRTAQILALLSCISALLIVSPATLHAAAYSLQDVGTDGTLPDSTATGLSDTGYVTGTCSNITTDIGFTWKSGVLTDLPLIDGYNDFFPGYTPQSVNSAGLIVGNAQDEFNGSTSYLYKNGVMNVLALQGPGGPLAMAINEAGQITGEDGSSKAYIFSNGTETPLPLTSDASGAVGNCINNSNPVEVAGYCISQAAYEATLWKNGTVYKLGTFGGPSSQAFGINDQGQVVGWSEINQMDSDGFHYIHHAFLWTPTTPNGTTGTMHDLGVLVAAPNTYSGANSINNAGSIVGTSGVYGNMQVFIWTSGTGMQNLAPMIGPFTVVGVPHITAASLTTATKINNKGQIAGSFAFTPSQDPDNETATSHGFVLTPTGGGSSQIGSLSFSPASVVAGAISTGSIALTAAAPTGGASVTITTDGANPQVLTLSAGSISATYSQPTGQMTAGAHTMTAAYGGATASATLTVTTNSSLPKPISLSYTPSTVAPGGTTTAAVTLSAPAPTGGASVSIIENGIVLGSIGMPAGQTVGSFPYNASTTVGTYTEAAVYNGVKVSTTLTVSNATAASLSSVSFNPTLVTGGANSTGTVTLTAAAPTGGAVVTLSSNSADVTVPSSVTVLAGATSATFAAQTTTVVSAVTATVTATYSSVMKTANLTVNPAAGVALKSVTLTPTSVVGGNSSTANRVTLTANATVSTPVKLSSSNTAVATVPATVSIASGSAFHAFKVTTKSVTTAQQVTITASYGGVMQTATLTVTPSTSGSVAISSLTFAPTSVVGGLSSTGTLTLVSAAPTGGEVVSLSSSAPATTVPASVTVAAGATTATFTATTTPVAATTAARITATAGPSSKIATLTVRVPSLLSVTLTPSTVVGGAANATGKITLNGAAPAGGLLVAVESDDPSLIVPDSVTVASGAKTATFTATTIAVASATTVTVSATYSSVTKTATETVNPGASNPIVPVSIVSNPNPVYSSGQSVLTITLSAAAPAGGLSVSLAENGTAFYTATVPAGQTASGTSINWPTVTTATTVTMAATANGTTVSTSVTIEPTAVALTSLKFVPSTVKGGASSQATATLSAAAPAGGATVSVTYNGTAWYSLIIPAGQTSGSYTQPTNATTTSESFTYVAAYNGVSKSATQKVTP